MTASFEDSNCDSKPYRNENMENFVVGIIGMGDMGRVYARRLSDAGWRYISSFAASRCIDNAALPFSVSIRIYHHSL